MYKKLYFYLKLAMRPFGRKAAAMIYGLAKVPSSCQIPGIRGLYRELDLSDRNGYFVEIGAFDGETYSNTSFLADQGWIGLYVEPIPKFAWKTRYRHLLNRVKVLACAVSDSQGMVEILVDGPLSTINSDNYEAHSDAGWSGESLRKELVPCKTLEDILVSSNVPCEFDLLVVDTEGGERKIIEDLFSGPFRPRVLVVELCDRHPAFSDHPRLQDVDREIRQMVLAFGYQQHYEDEINTVFVRK